jgi:hypothetical protein
VACDKPHPQPDGMRGYDCKNGREEIASSLWVAPEPATTHCTATLCAANLRRIFFSICTFLKYDDTIVEMHR